VLARASMIVALSGDRDAASRVGTLLAQRRQNLVAVGLERRAKDVPSLASYLESKAEYSMADDESETGDDN